jgi:hypothetical protein
MSSQPGWNWCHLCQGLFFSGNASQGVCPGNGGAPHAATGPSGLQLKYALLIGDDVAGAQPGWRWCRKCQGLFYSLNPISVCPDGVAHDPSQSGPYSLQISDSIPGTQGKWRWCTQCQGLFYAGGTSQGVCPSGGLAHDSNGSGPYGVPWPNPTTSFDTGTGAQSIRLGGDPADCNVAVSGTHVCITARGAFACYTKAGELVSPGPGFTATPYPANIFFEQSGISKILSVDKDPLSDTTKDARVVFDINRKRFFMVFQTREKLARLLIAVSKSEDPTDGFFVYADAIGTPGEDGHDYQRVGVNSNNLLVSDDMQKLVDPATNAHVFTRTRHLMYSAEDLATNNGIHRGEWENVAASDAAPCVHDSPCIDAFWVHRDNATQASVWGVRDGKVSTVQFSIQTSSGAINGVQAGGQVVDYGSVINWEVQNAQYRDGKIVFASNDGITWPGQSHPSSVVRLVQLDVSHFFDADPSVTVLKDRIYGLANADDPPGSLFDYGWPAVAANANGDIVVGCVRSNPTIFTQFRSSVWYRNNQDISPSVLIAQSAAALPSYHMAGACADPSSEGVYVAQQFGVADQSIFWQIRVAEMIDYPV